ncbi:MAG: Fic family protein [Bacteroidetes bacterium]|nr:Fic family protein [Bacteroidota bacterium]
MKPPYDITPQILKLVTSISENIGAINATHLQRPTTELRKKNRIKTIQSSLEIEGNTLSIEQITALMDNKRVLAPKKDILEVQNAIATYNQLNNLNYASFTSLCKAHKLLMTGLVDQAGKLRTKSVGIVKGNQLAHAAPPASMLKALLNDLFHYLKKEDELLLIKSCVFHYEFEFIHPFIDGNGRMGRLWQTLILKEYSTVFEFLPIELIIKQKQKEYYHALSLSDTLVKSTPFIEFMLAVINEALEDVLKTQNKTLSSEDRMNLFKEQIKTNRFMRQDYLRVFKEISTATASRDLKQAIDFGLLKKIGDKNKTEYWFK